MDDKSFDDAVFDAFDRMGPSAQAEDRMLKALLAAREDAEQHADRAADAPANAFVPATAHRGGRADAAAAAMRKRGRGRKGALAAACLALVVVAGAGAFAAFSANNAANMMAASGNAGSSNAIADATSPDPAAPLISEDGVGQAESAADGEALCPNVTLTSGVELRVAIGEDGPLAADPALVGELVELATAVSDDGESSAPCAVFVTSDPAHPYAVRYEGDGRCFLTDEVA